MLIIGDPKTRQSNHQSHLTTRSLSERQASAPRTNASRGRGWSAGSQSRVRDALRHDLSESNFNHACQRRACPIQWACWWCVHHRFPQRARSAIATANSQTKNPGIVSASFATREIAIPCFSVHLPGLAKSMARFRCSVTPFQQMAASLGPGGFLLRKTLPCHGNADLALPWFLAACPHGLFLTVRGFSCDFVSAVETGLIAAVP